MRGNDAAAVYPNDVPSLPETSVSQPREGRVTDASRLTFPLQLVVVIVGGILSAAISGWAFSSGIRESQLEMQSDIRDMRTRLEMQAQIDIARNDARGAEMKSQNDAITDLRRLTQLLQIQYNEIKKGDR